MCDDDDDDSNTKGSQSLGVGLQQKSANSCEMKSEVGLNALTCRRSIAGGQKQVVQKSDWFTGCGESCVCFFLSLHIPGMLCY